MRAGHVMLWLDQGPVLLLSRCKIEDPVPDDELKLYQQDAKWPSSEGWTISLLQTGEILDVHDDTLHFGM
jgi:hypothetical protein